MPPWMPENLLGDIAGRDQLLGIAYVVVLYHNKLHVRADFRIVIDNVGHYQQEMNDILSDHIRRCSLCTKK